MKTALGSRWLGINVYRWFPFDAHVLLCLTSTRLCIGYWYPSTQVEVTIYWKGRAHFMLHCGVGISVGFFWGDLISALRPARPSGQEIP